MVDNFEQEILFGDLLTPVAQISKRRAKRDSLLPEGLPEFRVVRSRRRRSSISAYRQGGVIQISIPARMSKQDEIAAIPEMIAMVLRREAKERKTDDQLMQIALELLSKLLPEFEIKPASINWRNMSERWGSCTTDDRNIRISDRLIGAPTYVLNYIIFHELIHLKVPGHDQDFKNYLHRFDDQLRAEAFLEGFEIGCQIGNSGVMSAVNI